MTRNDDNNSSNNYYPLFERKDDDSEQERGRHLVAKRPIPKGRLIFCERPLVALQSLGNPVWVCHGCKAFVGGPRAALQILVTHSMPTTTTAQQQQWDDDKEDEQSQWSVVPCRDQCGQVYCSKECEQDFWESRHRFLCTGKLQDENSPLIQFKRHAMETNEIFLLVAEWIVAAFTYSQQQHKHDESEAAIIQNSTTQTTPTSNNPFEDFLMAPWWNLGGKEHDNDTDHNSSKTEGDILKSLCEEACRLWKLHCQSSLLSKEEESQILEASTPLYMANIIGACELNSIGIRRRNPLCRDVFSRDLRRECKRELLACLEQAGMLQDHEEEEDDDDKLDEKLPSAKMDTSNGKSNSNNQKTTVESMDVDAAQPQEEGTLEYTDDDLARFLSELDIFEDETTKKGDGDDKVDHETSTDDNPSEDGCDDCQTQDDFDEIFSPLDGTAMYALTCKMNHSCDPNVVVLYKTRGWGAKHPLVAHCVALRDIHQGEELCISYIDTDDPVSKRREALAHYGFTCNCAKCQREEADQETTGQAIRSDERDAQKKPEDDDLFGSDDSDADSDDSTNNIATENGVASIEANANPPVDSTEEDGEMALERCLDRLDTVLNHYSMGSIPLPYLAQVSAFVIQTATAVDCDLQKDEDQVVKSLLAQCCAALRERDFVLCKTVGADLERTLFSMLRKHSSWPSVSYREAYRCGAVTASVGLAHQCSFLPAMYFLDKATVLGLTRQSIDSFFSYVEYHASQVAIGPFPPAGANLIVPDFASPSYKDVLVNVGLSQPIQFPLPEVTEKDLDSAYISKSQPAVVRKLAANWPATTKWRYFSLFCRDHGHRLVPIELGSMRGESGMKEELMTLRTFISDFLTKSSAKDCWSLQDALDMQQSVAYLAQHPLIDQIPILSRDINMKPCPCGPLGPTHVYLWIGTGGTRTPLHFDSYSNLFVQLVGAKYVRIYGYEETPKLYVSRKESYSLQGNMSDVDCEQEDYAAFPLAKDAKYHEVLLLPGDALFIPARAWHYVRSLSTSISVNYWF